MTIKVILLILFFGSMVAVGLYSRKHATNVNDFVLGGRSVGPWLTAFAYGTSYFSAVVFVGYAGQFGWKYGVSSTWIGLGNAIIGSLLAWVVLGRRTRVMTKHLQAATMPDYFGKRFDSDTMRVVASAIVFVFLVPYTASIYNGLSRLFGLAFDIPYAVCVIAMAALTGAYVILGGYMATAVSYTHLPKTGEVLPPGEIGELVITCITKEALPLIRYRTKDLTRLMYEPCKCGRTTVRMENLLGRTDDMLKIRGVNVFPSQIEEILLNIEECGPHYEIIVGRKNHSDTLEIKVEVSADKLMDSYTVSYTHLDVYKRQVFVSLQNSADLMLPRLPPVEYFWRNIREPG